MKNDTRTIREVTVKWEHNNGIPGKVESTDVRVNYFSPTIAQLKAERLAEEQRTADDPRALTWLSDRLAPVLHSLHGLPGEQSITNPPIDWLDEQDLKNITAVRDAIDEDLKGGK